MKPKRKTIFTWALNAGRSALNAASGMFQELTLGEGETTKRYRLSPYGEFPADDVQGKPIIQVIDREAATTLAANFGSLSTKFATFFRGIPIYEGHADNPEWLEKNPGHKASAVGRIKAIEAGDDGIYVTATLNSDGIGLLGGDAPKYSGHSPFWRLAEIKGRPGFFRPVLLWSDALTNTPNIMTNTMALNSLAGICGETEPSPSADNGNPENQDTNDMKLTPEALAALGFAPDATPSMEEICAAIVKIAAANKAEEAGEPPEVAAANTRVTALQTELTTIRGAAVETLVTDAINSGRITEADRPAWTTALNTSFISEADKLSKLMPVLNTRSRLPDLGGRRNEGVTDAANVAGKITEGVRAYALEKSIDITTEAGWTEAFNACRAANPALFAK